MGALPRLALLVAALVVAGGACDEDEAVPVPPGHVRIHDQQFSPREVVVEPNEPVTWTNTDEMNHWLVSAGPGGRPPPGPNVLDSGDLGHAQSWQWAFTAPGEYPYYCKIHNYMKGTVRVQYPEGPR